MTRADNSAYLAQANDRRHQAALLAATPRHPGTATPGQAVNFSTVAQSAGVSRGWLYRQDQIRDLISRQRHSSHQPPARLPRTAQPPTRSASGSTPPAPRTPACEPRTAPSATSSPAISASSGPSTTSTPQPSRDDPITTPTAAAKTCLRRRNARPPGIIYRRLHRLWAALERKGLFSVAAHERRFCGSEAHTLWRSS